MPTNDGRLWSSDILEHMRKSQAAQARGQAVEGIDQDLKTLFDLAVKVTDEKLRTALLEPIARIQQRMRLVR